MDKQKSTLIQYVLILVLGILIAWLIHYIRSRSNLNIVTDFAPDTTYTDNPLMGYAPDAGNTAQCEKSNLVYLSLTWAQWEPREGVYDIEGFEKRCNIEKWKNEHKHAVLRFVCDIPGDSDHIDIPQWLYDRTANGVHYDNPIGKGYSPDYSDKVFMERHDAALKALADYCNRDHFVAFVELGSLGHWGEWHATGNNGETIMPGEDICTQYASRYSDDFINARLLMRRNYEIAVKAKMGFYNDMIGDTKSTDEWLEWMENGGSQHTSEEPLPLRRVPRLGWDQPVGGEFTSSIPMEEMLLDDIGTVLAEVSSSHMTFIGPKTPVLTDEKYALAAESVLRRMGYRIYVSGLKTRYDYSSNSIELQLTFNNAGNAGFYFDWPVTVYIYDGNKQQIFWEGLPLDLRDLNAGEAITVTSMVPATSDLRDEFYVGVAITDYSGEEYLKLAIDTGGQDEYIGDVQILYHHVGL